MSVPRRTLETLRKELALLDGAIRALEKIDSGRLIYKPLPRKMTRLSLVMNRQRITGPDPKLC